jgi:CRP/FNR family transcriptional regulator, anaerobic regulatory protein
MLDLTNHVDKAPCMIDLELLRKHFPLLDLDLLKELSQHAVLKEIAKGVEVIKEGQHVKMIPLVVKGLVKVFSRYEDRELLLYYIRPSESCVMSFIAGLRDQPSRIFAVTEQPSTLVLLPAQYLDKWIREYPRFNSMFYDLYNIRYSDMLDTIHHLVFERLDQRIIEHLRMKAGLSGSSIIEIRHREIANDLGTSREVITRVLRKLEKENKIVQEEGQIRIL